MLEGCQGVIEASGRVTSLMIQDCPSVFSLKHAVGNVFLPTLKLGDQNATNLTRIKSSKMVAVGQDTLSPKDKVRVK